MTLRELIIYLRLHNIELEDYVEVYGNTNTLTEPKVIETPVAEPVAPPVQPPPAPEPTPPTPIYRDDDDDDWDD